MPTQAPAQPRSRNCGSRIWAGRRRASRRSLLSAVTIKRLSAGWASVAFDVDHHFDGGRRIGRLDPGNRPTRVLHKLASSKSPGHSCFIGKLEHLAGQLSRYRHYRSGRWYSVSPFLVYKKREHYWDRDESPRCNQRWLGRCRLCFDRYHPGP